MKESHQVQLTPREHLTRWTRILLGTLRYWPAIAVGATLAVVAAMLAPKLLPPVYESSTVLLHRELISASNVLGVQGYQGESNLQRNTRLREMLLSRTNLQKIVEDLGLYADTVASQGVIDAVEEMRKNTECKVGSANTFSIRYGGGDPAVVFTTIERLSETLIAQSSNYRREQAESTKDFLEAQHQGTRKELNASEQSLAKFLADHPEFAYDLTAGGTYAPGASLRASQPKAVVPGVPKGAAAAALDRTALALERQAERLRLQLQADDALKAGAALPPPRPTSKPKPLVVDPEKQRALDDARSNLAQAESELASALATYTPKHPDVIAKQGRVNTARAKVRSADAAAKASATSPDAPDAPIATPGQRLTDGERRELNQRLILVNDKINARLKADGKTVPTPGPEPLAKDDVGERIVALETQWAAVNRELDAIRERDQRLQRQLFEASIVAKVEASGNASQIVVIDAAFKPERPARRGPRRTSAIAAALLLMLGTAFALLLSILDDRPQDEIDLRRMNLGPISHTLPFGEGMPSAKRGKTPVPSPSLPPSPEPGSPGQVSPRPGEDT